MSHSIFSAPSGHKVYEETLEEIRGTSNEAQRGFVAKMMRNKIGSNGFDYQSQVYINRDHSMYVMHDFSAYVEQGIFVLRLDSKEDSHHITMYKVWSPNAGFFRINIENIPDGESWWSHFDDPHSKLSKAHYPAFAVPAHGFLEALGSSIEAFDRVGKKAAMVECTQNSILYDDFVAWRNSRNQ